MYITDWILGQALKDSLATRVWVGTNVQASDSAYTDDIVLLSNNYRESKACLKQFTAVPQQLACVSTL